jgi:hypothetical protein
MQRKLYKVKVSTDLMVMAQNKREAEEVAKKNAVNEIQVYGDATVSVVKHLSDIPQNWKSVIPYTPEMVAQETRSCMNIFRDEHEDDIVYEDLDEIVKIQKNSKPMIEINDDNKKDEVMPETRPDPEPRELDWTETISGRPLPPLKFNIPEKKK